MAERGRITAEDAARWTVLDNQTIIWRGQELVDTGPVVAFAEILTEIIHGGYPEPPPGHAWFFGLPEVSTIKVPASYAIEVGTSSRTFHRDACAGGPIFHSYPYASGVVRPVAIECLRSN